MDRVGLKFKWVGSERAMSNIKRAGAVQARLNTTHFLKVYKIIFFIILYSLLGQLNYEYNNII